MPRSFLGVGRRGRRLSQYDECWPIRASFRLTRRTSNYSSSSARDETFELCIYGMLRRLCCCLTCHVLCCLFCLTACVPCCHFYSCRKNASVNRYTYSHSIIFIILYVFNMFLKHYGAL